MEKCKYCDKYHHDYAVCEEYIDVLGEKPFATANLQQLHGTKFGICEFCDKEGQLCEHGFCSRCICKNYCWLD